MRIASGYRRHQTNLRALLFSGVAQEPVKQPSTMAQGSGRLRGDKLLHFQIPAGVQPLPRSYPRYCHDCPVGEIDQEIPLLTHQATNRLNEARLYEVRSQLGHYWEAGTYFVVGVCDCDSLRHDASESGTLSLPSLGLAIASASCNTTGLPSRPPCGITTLLEGDINPTPETTVGPLPVVSADQSGTPSLLTPLTAFPWFIEHGARHNSGWQNQATRAAPSVPEPFHSALAAPFVTVPTLALISPDDQVPGANPQVSRPAFNAIAGPTEIVDIEGDHFGIMFDPSPELESAIRMQTRFLMRHL